MKYNKFTIAVFMLMLMSFDGMEAQEISPAENNSLRIMSYNVRNCRGMDDVTDFDRVAAVINRVDADVIALQELDSMTARQGVYVLSELAGRTLKHYTYGAAIDYQGGKYGVGVLSKEKPLKHWSAALPGREERRVLLIVEFDGYVVCCTHFSLTREDRELSVPVIVNVVKDIGKPLFLAGDMNAVYDSREQELLREHFKVLNDHKENTIPAVNPQRCIDYIYSYNNGNPLSVLRREVLFDEQAASDHLPLFVDVRLHTAAGKTMEAKPYLQNPANNGTATSRITNVPVRGRVGYGMDFLRDGATRSICCVRHGLRLRRRPDASICLKALYIIYSAQLGIT